MALDYYIARDYVLSQPFVEKTGDGNILRFNPYALQRKETDLDKVQSKLGELRQEALARVLRGDVDLGQTIEGLCPPYIDGSLDLFLDPSRDRQERLGVMSASLTERLILEQIAGSGISLENFSQLFHEVRLKEKVAKELKGKYGLDLSSDSKGIIILTREFPDYGDIDNLLSFCVAYHEKTNKPEFNRKVKRLCRKINSRLESLAEEISKGNNYDG